MNKTAVIIIVLLAACNKYNDQQNVSDNVVDFARSKASPSTVIPIDTDKSYIKWKGNKLIGSSHEGTVKFKSGNLQFSEKIIVGGTFLADMKSIYITDIPESEPVPRKNLTEHLNEDFKTDKFPESRFSITNVKYTESGNYIITGDLSIKGITNSLSFEAMENQNGYSTQFRIDRFDWKVGEDGSWLEKKVVNAEIELEVYVVL